MSTILQSSSAWKTELGDLSNPQCLTNAINISGFDCASLVHALHTMIQIRLVEEIIADMATAEQVKCPVHLAIGQEAAAVGVAKNLRTSDRAFGNHRSHSHYLAMGGSVRKLFAEVQGKYTGCSRGYGGSMHLYAQEQGFYGSVPIVAGTVPLALGAAMAAKLDDKGDVAVAFLGDGACEEGVVQECLNMASTMALPIIFVVENNLFSSHLDINLRQPSDKISRFAEAARMAYCTIDGNDVVTVMKESKKFIDRARVSHAPALVEAVTYRWRGHVGPREDIDVGLRRSPEDIVAWKKRDPIARLLQSLIAAGHYSPDAFDKYIVDTRDAFTKLSIEVADDPFPPEATLLDYVYAGK